jgi:hypothetical protein
MEFKALFLDEGLNELGNKNFQPTDEFITFKNGTFNIRLNAFLYRTKNFTYYAYIYPTDEKMLIDIKIEPITDNKDNIYSARIVKLKEKLEHGDLKLIVGENIIGQLAHMAVMGLKNNWVLILIVAIAVGIGAGGIGYSIGVSHVPTYLNATATSPSLTVMPTPRIVG